MDVVSDRSRHRILECEHVLQFAIIAISPEIGLVRDLNQVNGDSYAVGGAANATLDQVVGVQLAANFVHGQVATFVLCN